MSRDTGTNQRAADLPADLAADLEDAKAMPS